MGDPLTLGIAGFNAASNALGMLSRFVDARDEAKVLALKSELIGLLVEAQTAQLALVEEKRQLAERVRELEAWGREKERYQLAEVASGNFAYTLKAETQGGEPPHMACANCFQHGRRSILQGFAAVHSNGERYFRCANCNAQITARASTHQGPKGPAPGRRGSWMGS